MLPMELRYCHVQLQYPSAHEVISPVYMYTESN